MYYHLFSFINEAAKAAKVVTTRPIISGLADVDYLVGDNGQRDKVSRFEYLIPDVDAWAVQLYRGASFGGYPYMFSLESSKALIVTEFVSVALFFFPLSAVLMKFLFSFLVALGSPISFPKIWS